MPSKRSSNRTSGSNISDAPSSNTRGGSKEALSKNLLKRAPSSNAEAASKKPQLSKEQVSKNPKAEVSRDAPSKNERKKKKEEEDKKKKEAEKKKDEIRKKAKEEMKKQKTLVNTKKKLVRSKDDNVDVLHRVKKVDASGIKTNTKKKKHKTRRHKRGSRESTNGSGENVSMVRDRGERSAESLISARDLTHGDMDSTSTNFSALTEALGKAREDQLKLLLETEKNDKKQLKRQEKMMGKQAENFRKMMQGRKAVEAELFARTNEIALIYIIALEKEAVRLKEFPVPHEIYEWTRTLASKLIPLMLMLILTVIAAGLLFGGASNVITTHSESHKEFMRLYSDYDKTYFFDVHRLVKKDESYGDGIEQYPACPIYDVGQWRWIKDHKNKKTNKTSSVFQRTVTLKLENRMRIPDSLAMKCPPSIYVVDNLEDT